jgi:NAD(P)H dehydrogenase (quinone)
MNILIIYAHPEPTSFSAAMKNTARDALTAAGHHVEVSDLYAEGFNPVAGRHDFTTVADESRFHYQSEQMHAAKNGGYSAELAREQARLNKADFFIFIFPIWWGGLPAILKGWFDRVCSYGVAYADGKRFNSGYFFGRRAIIGVPTGGTPQRFSDGDAYGDIKRVLYPTQRCMLEYLGLDVLDPFVAYAAPRVEQKDREAYLADWTKRLVEAAGDPAWHRRLKESAAQLEQNRAPVEGTAWAAKR